MNTYLHYPVHCREPMAGQARVMCHVATQTVRLHQSTVWVEPSGIPFAHAFVLSQNAIRNFKHRPCQILTVALESRLRVALTSVRIT